MGKTRSAYRANAAFTLYGILKQQQQGSSTSSSQSRRNHCTQSTYINSFFTTSGAAILSDSIGTIQTNDMVYATSECVYGPDNEGVYKSTTMGCDETGEFTYASFAGKYCDGSTFSENLMTLSNYTKAMIKHVDCLQVWDYSTYVTNNNHNNNRHLQEDEKNDKEDEQQGYGSLAEQILQDSQVCDLKLNPEDCPDPYGRKNVYDVNLLRAQAGLGPENLMNPNKPYLTWSWVLIVLAIVTSAFTYYMAPDSKKSKVHQCFSCCLTFFGRPSEKEITDEEYDEDYDANRDTPPSPAKNIFQRIGSSRRQRSVRSNSSKQQNETELVTQSQLPSATEIYERMASF